MRTLSFIFVLICAVGVSAQSKAITKPFSEGTGFAKAGDFESALARYRTALDASKLEQIDIKFLARLHYNLGVCEYRLNRPDRAVDELAIAIGLRGKDYPAAYYALGMAESSRQNWPKARLAFIGALKGNEPVNEAWFDLAFAYLRENNFDQAETAFRQAIAHKSIDTPLSHNNIGVILAIRGDLSAAKIEFESALRVSDGRLKMADKNLKFCEMYERTDELEARRFEITPRIGQ